MFLKDQLLSFCLFVFVLFCFVLFFPKPKFISAQILIHIVT